MLTIRSRGFGCGEKIIARCLVKHLNVDVVVITTAQLHSSKSELRFCAGSNPARGVLENRDG